MTENKRFTNIEHDYENAWIKCNDNGDFMIYAIYKELDESLPSLENLLNGLADENKKLQRELEECKNNKIEIREIHDIHKGLDEWKLKCLKCRYELKQDKPF